jgi:Amt family ammonium transporter
MGICMQKNGVSSAKFVLLGGFTMNAINGADTTWVLISSALVMLMTPGLAHFYGGLVRQKNVLHTHAQLFHFGTYQCAMGIVGYSLAYGRASAGLSGGFDWVGLKGVGLEPNPDYAATIPHLAFMVFQMMFGIITPALIRPCRTQTLCRLPLFFHCCGLPSFMLLSPTGYGAWVAGSTISAHLTSPVGLSSTSPREFRLWSALCCVFGKRLGYGDQAMQPHNATLTIIGTGLLWFGWFGFNAGSSLAANGIAVSAFVTTNTAAAAATLAWLAASWIRHKRPSVLGVSAGAVAGLVGITPAAGFVTPMAAVVIGIVTGLVCFFAVEYVVRGRVDDALDVFGVHGIGGITGALLTGVFASKVVNPAGFDGLLYGNPGQLLTQAIAVVAVAA